MYVVRGDREMPGVLDPHGVPLVVLDELREEVWVTEDVDVRV